MLEFTRHGASGSPKAIVWTDNEKKSCTQISMLTKLVDYQLDVSNNCHKLDQALHISAANSDLE